MSHFLKLPLRNLSDAFKIGVDIYYIEIISLNNVKIVFCLEVYKRGMYRRYASCYELVRREVK